MPELPEVETVVRGLRAPLAGRTITGAQYDYPGGLVRPDGPIFTARIAGQPIRSLSRRGKYVMIKLDPDTLIIHLKMTGRLYVAPDGEEQHADRWVHFTFQLDNAHQLRFSDSRKFGRVYLVEDPAEVVGALGPEPLDDSFTLDEFRARLARRSGALKPLLLNQGLLAGVGNIYADEALFRAGLHPLSPGGSMKPEHHEALREGIVAALERGLDLGGASIDDYRDARGDAGAMQNEFLVHRREGDPCGECGVTIVRIVVGGRSTYFCPACQKRLRRRPRHSKTRKG